MEAECHTFEWNFILIYGVEKNKFEKPHQIAEYTIFQNTNICFVVI